MSARRYRRRPPEVDAVIVTTDRADHAAVWACGTVEYLAGHPIIQLPDTTAVAHVGDYLVRAVLPTGLGPAYVMERRIFEHCYQPSRDNTGHRPRRNPNPRG